MYEPFRGLKTCYYLTGITKMYTWLLLYEIATQYHTMRFHDDLSILWPTLDVPYTCRVCKSVDRCYNTMYCGLMMIWHLAVIDMLSDNCLNFIDEMVGKERAQSCITMHSGVQLFSCVKSGMCLHFKIYTSICVKVCKFHSSNPI